MRHYLIFLILFSFAGSFVSAGEEKPAKPFRVAVMPFDTSKVETKAWGNEVAELVSALLSTKDNVQLVERGDLDKLIKEHSLNLTGATVADEQIRLGKLSGAQFLVMGRIFPIGRDVCIVAKVVGVETTKVSAVVVQAPLTDKLTDLVNELAQKLGTAIIEKAEVLLPKVEPAKDVVQNIKDALAKDKTEGPRAGMLPKLLIQISETHTRPVRDPAAATEFLIIAKAAGFTVTEVGSAKQALSEWAVHFLKDTDAKLPAGVEGTDIVLIGEGISEFGARNSDLVTSIARLEVQAVDTRTGRVLAVGRKTTRATDLAENIAAKSALEQAANEIADRLIPDAVAAWRKAGNEKAEKK